MNYKKLLDKKYQLDRKIEELVETGELTVGVVGLVNHE